ncbi:DsbA family protein [Marinomonas profundimaris]|uniref:Protein-disulfide isomerase n=1 Tax=Marinomonas profundimaris TaxID=1208321 RepID=W1RPY2_9GAMM|nr:DsbA family protein [Marinomonas profundimaris]ETI58762.1 protein-disulfide isomerase [Marinomonas profundimaris]
MVKVHYFFDPMCGWCYGASSLIKTLAEMPGFEMTYHPGGMIPKRAIDPSFRQHILQADSQIATMTKAKFGEVYKARVASSGEFVIDSYLPTQAFMVGIEMGIEPHVMLKAIQLAHYQDGKALDKPEALKALAVSLGLDEATWTEKMAGAEPAMMKVIEDSQTLMDQLQVNGFPTLIMEKDGQLIRLPHSTYYGKPIEWKAHLTSLI